jgi:hypothetical protein
MRLREEFPARLLQADSDLGPGTNVWNWHAVGVSKTLWNLVKACLKVGMTKENIIHIINSMQNPTADEKREQDQDYDADDGGVSAGIFHAGVDNNNQVLLLTVFCLVFVNVASRKLQANSMMHGRQTLPPRNNQARMMPLRVKGHLLFLALRQNIPLHPRLHRHNPNRSHKLKLSLVLDKQAHMYTATILDTHTTPNPLKIKALRLRQFLSRTPQVSKAGSSEHTATERTLVKWRFWSRRRSDLDTAASAARRTVKARAGACTVTSRARIAGRVIVRAGTAGVRIRCAQRRGIRCWVVSWVHGTKDINDDVGDLFAYSLGSVIGHVCITRIT